MNSDISKYEHQLSKILAYAEFRGNVQGIVEGIDWINLSNRSIKKLLEGAIKNLDVKLNEINGRE